MGAEYTPAQKAATIKYLTEKTDDIRVRVPKGTKARWNAAAEAAGVSTTRFIVDAVEEKISRQTEK